MKVSHWFSALARSDPLNEVCSYGPFHGKSWREVISLDPEWVLRFITESRVLLPREIEQELMKEIKKYVFEGT
jgi:hypothetical protein